MNKSLHLPLQNNEAVELVCGDRVLVSGVLITARDRAHRWLFDQAMKPDTGSNADDAALNGLRPYLLEGAIYHCGPVVTGHSPADYRVTAAGPTTSLRQELYMPEIIRQYGIRAVIGKGGMGQNTLNACRERKAVYLHTIGGAAGLLAACVRQVAGVFRNEFGMAEAMWLFEVEDFPAVVTMDTHGRCLHDEMGRSSKIKLMELINGGNPSERIIGK